MFQTLDETKRKIDPKKCSKRNRPNFLEKVTSLKNWKFIFNRLYIYTYIYFKRLSRVYLGVFNILSRLRLYIYPKANAPNFNEQRRLNLLFPASPSDLQLAIRIPSNPFGARPNLSSRQSVALHNIASRRKFLEARQSDHNPCLTLSPSRRYFVQLHPHDLRATAIY